MHLVDLGIVIAYMAAMLVVGALFFKRQSKVDEFFVGDRKMGAGHIGLSVVATDVGGGFSIGLGGLGFTMGLSGSWLLFTGLVGAWLAAVLLIPRVKPLADKFGWLTYPDFLEHRFNVQTRAAAALVSGLGYAGFVGGQVLAGAKLSAAAFEIDLTTAVWLTAIVVVVYTAFGGLQAVIYTDTVQWLIVLFGLIFLAMPFAYFEVGGIDGIRAAVPPGHLSLTNVSLLELLTWALTIIPIWFVGQTLYQRIYATRDVKTAKRAWYFAGLLEYPIMAFVGAVLGMMARIAFPDVESEMGLPLLIREVLPIGITGLVIAAYFSAIMSTADSCLLASVGNIVNDIYQRHINPTATSRRVLIISRTLTLLVGLVSVSLALALPKVLDTILLAYAFMVSGLFVPTLGGLLWKRASAAAALTAMIGGGGVAVFLSAVPAISPVAEPILIALPVSAVLLVVVSLFVPNKKQIPSA